MNKKLPLLTLFITLLFCTRLFATTYTFTNGGNNNLWSNTANWASGALPPNPLASGNQITVNALLKVDMTRTIEGTIVPATGQNIELMILQTTGNLTLSSSATVGNFYKITNLGTLTNGLTLTIGEGKTFTQQGIFNNNSEVNNQGLFTDVGALPNSSTNNFGKFTNSTTGILRVFSKFNNFVL
jgi:hypothetical protein